MCLPSVAYGPGTGRGGHDHEHGDATSHVKSREWLRHTMASFLKKKDDPDASLSMTPLARVAALGPEASPLPRNSYQRAFRLSLVLLPVVVGIVLTHVLYTRTEVGEGLFLSVAVPALLWTAVSQTNFLLLVFMQTAALLNLGLNPTKHRPAPADAARAVEDLTEFPSVSIVKPLHGLRSYSADCIERILALRYPGNFDIAFCFMSDTDALIPVVEDLCRKYPHVKTKLYTGCQKSGVNPKINNMRKACAAADKEIIWMLDDNVAVEQDDLTSLVAPLVNDPRCGLVHQFPGCTDTDDQPGQTMEHFNAATMNGWIFSLSDWAETENVGLGKSILMKRTVLNRLGGLEAFDEVIGEDYFLFKTVINIGLLPRLAFPCTVMYNKTHTIENARTRWLRWGLLRRFMIGNWVYAELMVHHSIIITSWALNLGFWFPGAWASQTAVPLPVVAAASYWLVSYLCVETITKIVSREGVLKLNPYRFGLFVLADCMNVFNLFASKFHSTLQWGDVTYRLLPGGGAEKVE